MQPKAALKKSDFEFALFKEVNSWKDSELKEVALYALDGEAKRMRPLIALEIALELNPQYENYHPMIALELAHTSSLIMDDLPLMDDAPSRRGKVSAHQVFGEQKAFLASVGLISESYLQLKKAAQLLAKTPLDKKKWDILLVALESTSMAGGLSGAPLGQWMDLSISETKKYPLPLLMYKKTGVFFESAFVLGWAFGGGDLKKLPRLVFAAKLFGEIFQIMDDFLDQQEDALTRAHANFVLAQGTKASYKVLEEKKEALRAVLLELDLVHLERVLLEPIEVLLIGV